LAGFDIAHPLKIEIETWWLKGEQITPCHESLFSGFIKNGIQVYANCALIQGVNDDPEIIEVLAHRVRDAGMEFHQVYTQGLEIQKRVTREGAVTRTRVGAIASRIRKNCTGREIPLYVGYTPDGEIDFTLLEQSSGMG
jgi:L-lysine 2,3-aminomutase